MIILVEKGVNVDKNRYGVTKYIDYLANFTYEDMTKEINRISKENFDKNIVETFLLSRKNKSCLKHFKEISGLVIGFEDNKDKEKFWFNSNDNRIKTLTIKQPKFEIVDIENKIISVPSRTDNVKIEFDEVARQFYCIKTNDWIGMPREFYHECIDKLL